MFEDVAFGNTKVFVRTPRTLTLLEQERAARIPQVVLIMQRVSPGLCRLEPAPWGVCQCLGFYCECVERRRRGRGEEGKGRGGEEGKEEGRGSLPL